MDSQAFQALIEKFERNEMKNFRLKLENQVIHCWWNENAPPSLEEKALFVFDEAFINKLNLLALTNLIGNLHKDDRQAGTWLMIRIVAKLVTFQLMITLSSM